MSTTACPVLRLKAQCLCTAQVFTTSLSPSDLPLVATLCHCNSCRYVTGSLYTSDVPWPGDTSEIRSSGLARYKFSENVNVLFCGVCGSPMYFEERAHAAGGEGQEGAVNEGSEEGDGRKEEDGKGKEDGKEWKTRYDVFTGVLEFVGLENLPPEQRETHKLVEVTEHGFVGDTVDGGAVGWLRTPNGLPNGNGIKPARVFLGRRGASEEVVYPDRWPAFPEAVRDHVSHDAIKEDETQKGVVIQDEEEGNIPVKCHCGGIHLVYRAGLAQSEFRNAKQGRKELGELHWCIVDPETHKGMGSIDACESCRRMVGVDLTYWTFPYLRHLEFATAGDEFPRTTFDLRKRVDDKDPRMGTLKYFASSEHVQRYFCGRCSASVFYAVDQDYEVVNLPVGLLRAPEGARAESAISWSWGGGLIFRQDMLGTWREGFLRGVERETEEYRIARGYPKNWRRVKRELEAAGKASEGV